MDSVRRFVEALRLITLADSLGGVESLIAHPATMTHVTMGAEGRRAAGIGDDLLQSVGGPGKRSRPSRRLGASFRGGTGLALGEG